VKDYSRFKCQSRDRSSSFIGANQKAFSVLFLAPALVLGTHASLSFPSAKISED
jgi:hypothetical protein